jgi:hypothetical protein
VATARPPRRRRADDGSGTTLTRSTDRAAKLSDEGPLNSKKSSLSGTVDPMSLLIKKFPSANAVMTDPVA